MREMRKNVLAGTITSSWKKLQSHTEGIDQNLLHLALFVSFICLNFFYLISFLNYLLFIFVEQRNEARAGVYAGDHT